MDSFEREACIFSTMLEYDRVDKGKRPLGLKSALDHIGVYPTFTDYSNKILVKKNGGDNKEISLIPISD